MDNKPIKLDSLIFLGNGIYSCAKVQRARTLLEGSLQILRMIDKKKIEYENKWETDKPNFVNVYIKNIQELLLGLTGRIFSKRDIRKCLSDQYELPLGGSKNISGNRIHFVKMVEYTNEMEFMAQCDYAHQLLNTIIGEYSGIQQGGSDEEFTYYEVVQLIVGLIGYKFSIPDLRKAYKWNSNDEKKVHYDLSKMINSKRSRSRYV